MKKGHLRCVSQIWSFLLGTLQQGVRKDLKSRQNSMEQSYVQKSGISELGILPVPGTSGELNQGKAHGCTYEALQPLLCHHVLTHGAPSISGSTGKGGMSSPLLHCAHG